MKFLKAFKLFVISVICVAVLGMGLLVPQRTHAYWGIFDTDFDVWTLGESIAEYAGTVAQWVKEESWKVMRDVAVKVVVRYINQQTVKFIQCAGRESQCGSPAFVTDWKQMLRDVGDQTFSQMMFDLKATALCKPFKYQINIAMIPLKGSYGARAECTLNDVVKNINDFYDNFQNGGWIAYGKSWNAENNFYMQLLTADDEQKSRLIVASDAKKSDVSASQGFLSVKDCTGKDAQTLYNECVARASAGGPASQQAISQCYDEAAKNENQVCTNKTPGNAVGDAVKNMIGSENIYVSGVQSIISTAIDAGINRMMEEGLSAMSGGERKNKGVDPSGAIKDDLDVLYADDRKNLSDQIKPFYDQWKALFDIKTASINLSLQRTSTLQAIMDYQKLVSCPPQVTNDDLSTEAAAKAKMQADADIMAAKVNEAQQLLDKIKTYNPTNIRERTGTSNDVKDFVQKYRSESGNDPTVSTQQRRKDYSDEQNIVQQRLSTALQQLGTCKAVKEARDAAASATSTRR